MYTIVSVLEWFGKRLIHEETRMTPLQKGKTTTDFTDYTDFLQ